MNALIVNEQLPGYCEHTAQAVTPKLPKPSICRYCNGDVVLSHQDLVFPRRSGTWPFLYVCLKCKATVDTHTKTDCPKGTLASAPLRLLRCKAHNSYDEMLAITDMTPDEGVQWLSNVTGMRGNRCAFDFFEEKQCVAVMDGAQALVEFATQIRLEVAV